MYILILVFGKKNLYSEKFEGQITDTEGVIETSSDIVSTFTFASQLASAVPLTFEKGSTKFVIKQVNTVQRVWNV